MKIKNIGFDARLIGETGVGRYIKNLLDNLSKIDKVNHYYVFLKSEDFNRLTFPNHNFHKIALDIRWHSIKEQLYLPFILSKYRFDIVHFPYFNVPLLYPGKYIVTVHDLIIDHNKTGRASTMPGIFYRGKRLFYKLIMNNALKKAAKILAISESTKKEIIDHYHISSAKIIVTSNALDSDFLTLSRKHQPKKYYDFNYLLFVGNAYPHKNLEALVEVFSDSRINQKIKLVLAGDDWFFYPRLKELVKQKKLTKFIYFFGRASNSQLIDLYAFARTLIVPSLMEGFGLPNLEAVQLGLLPLVSDIPAFREVWHDHLIYFNPQDLNDIKKAITSHLRLSPSHLKKLHQSAKEVIRQYSWKQTAATALFQYKNS
ncbi:hypothetical protein A2W14_07090 [Candidatus Gottesmanbacteria bacterium RBG_16_37_8]|uniref:Glycosyl transferase family 1 domain-containing protein n=1 Tax=Candidatus Gottesmanbacteria bacterium RBG_16_37_8 TaxID=1798371 RepID=A0A1F5YW49_9BACT|nr:MAG: hypothetical protein A2W14_07090 [Candidatus Gottesmanbacteria bacterium RBG_16_37_8]